MHTLQLVTVLITISSLFSFFTTDIPFFFKTTWTGLSHSLSEIGLITLASKSFITLVFSTSLILGLIIRWGYTIGLKLSSIRILWVQFHAIVLLCFLSVSSNFSFWSTAKLDAIVTESFNPFLRNAYSKWLDNFFSSNFWGSSMVGLSFFLPPYQILCSREVLN